MISLPIRTERLYLRRFLPEDAENLYAYLSDEETVRFEPYPPLDPETCRAEAEERAENPDFIAVCTPPDAEYPAGKLIGHVFFSPCAFMGAELAYVFNRAYWHRGYAAEACRAVMEQAFAEGETRRVVAMCDPENTASWRLMERIGMRREGRLIKNMALHTDENGNPVWQDTFLYAVLKDEYQIKNQL